MAKVIEFPPSARSEFDRDAISFQAVVDGKPILCIVKAELLRSHFEPLAHTELQLLNCFASHRVALEATARQLIEAGQIDAKGEVLITTKTYRP